MAAPALLLPAADGSLYTYHPSGASLPTGPVDPPVSRVAYAAAHVVADPLAPADPVAVTSLDWDATLSYRHHLWSQGLGVAEAMDTAQRGAGLDWTTSAALIRRSASEAAVAGGRIVCGAGTDDLDPARPASLPEVQAAYERQCAWIEEAGGQVVLMASRALAACARQPDDYAKVYDHLLSQVSRPVIIHWLGEPFDPQLAGYWGTDDVTAAGEVLLDIIRRHPQRVDGVKVSLLDADFEVTFRRRLPAGVRMYTGDDFNYPDLIAGDQHGHSDALLGIFDAIAPVAARALAALDRDDHDRYAELLDPTAPLARHLFSTPTRWYKTGLVFLAYLNGHQRHFRMVGGQEGARSVVHLAEAFRLADAAGLLADPELAAERIRRVLAVAGVDA